MLDYMNSNRRCHKSLFIFWNAGQHLHGTLKIWIFIQLFIFITGKLKLKGQTDPVSVVRIELWIRLIPGIFPPLPELAMEIEMEWISRYSISSRKFLEFILLFIFVKMILFKNKKNSRNSAYD